MIRATNTTAAAALGLSLLLAACDSPQEPTNTVSLTVVAVPEIARVGIDTVVVSFTMRNRGAEAVTVTEMTSAIVALRPGGYVSQIRQTGWLEIPAGDSLVFDRGRVFLATADSSGVDGVYEVNLSLDNLGVIARDTFEYVQ
jgi:hypothetical protein